MNMKRAVWFLAGALGCAALLFGQEAVSNWADRLARWTAVRDADGPIRNAVHLRQNVTANFLFGLQAQFYTVPAGRRLLVEQMAVYCTFGNNFGARLDQAHVSSLTGGVAARYPLARTVFDANREFLAGPMTLYADGDTPVVVNLVFSQQTAAACEITATGQLIQLTE